MQNQNLQVLEDLSAPGPMRKRDHSRNGEIAISLFTELEGIKLLRIEVKTGKGTADLLFSAHEPEKFFKKLKTQTFNQIGSKPDLSQEAWRDLSKALMRRLSTLSGLHSQVLGLSKIIRVQMESAEDEMQTVSNLINPVREHAKIVDAPIDAP